jgi:hypothetical protein
MGCIDLLCGLIVGWRGLIKFFITLLAFNVFSFYLRIVHVQTKTSPSHFCNIFNGLTSS